MKTSRAIIDHRWCEARQLSSPNHDARPASESINLLVIHNISLPAGEFGTSYVQQFFCNELCCEQHESFKELENVKVSAHIFINRLGEAIQFVAFDQKAWHAGVSQYCGKANCNDYSIGIELEGSDTSAFTEAQYKVLIRLTQHLLSEYPAMHSNRIVGHCDIAPGRKTDPGPCFEWDRYLKAVSEGVT